MTLNQYKKIIVLATLLASFSTNSENLPMQAINPSSTMLELLDEAKKMMKFTGNVSMPKLYSMNEKDLQKKYCTSGSTKCDVVTAMYDDGAIIYDEDFDPKHPVWRSIIFHEMVHHIQYYKKRGGAKDCVGWYQREIEAYFLQAAYLRNNKSSDQTVIDAAKAIICPP